ncbi:hypothetical protein AMATHDRAFT_65926 [Amanita thiersii Skay4041]|uniref:FAD/NAD(P)-binding domain-containing protein n=1 Tax=Amanita thiersii Skay4041 TaxID=703135 RepID=A0A2A9NC80_9AGAR|nr:hypothetical protein AMATHDRAFT_65926 [Amanita thiersii Skay4041]
MREWATTGDRGTPLSACKRSAHTIPVCELAICPRSCLRSVLFFFFFTSVLYQPYPKNWPTYTPAGKLATWLEFYAKSQDLVIWTKSRPVPTPTYDYSTRRWTVNIDRNGDTVTLHPVHIIVATGTLGKPYVPDLAGKHLFKGKAFHTSQYTNGKPFAGKNVVVIGTGNSATDICLELSVHNVKSMTVVQRSSTTVVNTDTVGKILGQMWPEDIPTHISDFKFSSIPLFLMKKNTSEQAGQLWVEEHETLRKLRKAGLRVDLGDGDSGVYPLVFERLGVMDVGFADFADTGKVKIISGVELVRFEENGIALSDGTILKADVVIFGTSFHNIRHSVVDLFGEETIEKTSRVWGLDEEGELYGCYRPTGHPGLWYGAGDFHNSRFGSKQLGVLIKAIELGYVKF